MPDTAADILAPSDPTWTPPPANIPATVAAPPPSGPTPEMQQVQPQVPTSIPSQAEANYQPGERDYHESWWRRTLDAVGTILGGDQTYKITKSPDGTMTASYEPSTTGEKWGRVARAALGGAAQGLANSQGPGGLARAAAAGTQFGLNQSEQARADVNKQLLSAAQNARLNQEIVANAWSLKNLPKEYQQKQADWALNHAKMLDELGAIPVGMGVKNHDTLTKLGVANPAAVDAHMGQNGEMIYNEPDGKGGVNIYRIPGSVANQRTTQPDTWEEVYLDPDDPTKTKTREHTTPAGEKVGDYMKRRMAQQVANDKITSQAFNNKMNQKKAEKPANPTVASLALDAATNPDPVKAAQSRRALDLTKEKAGTGTSGGAGEGGFNPQATLEQNAEMMVDGLSAPSQMSKRAKDYNQMLPLAQAYSWKKYGEPFDAEISEARYAARKDVLKEFAGGKPADQIQSFQAFANHAQNLLDDVAHFRTTNVRLANMGLNALKRQTDPAIGPLMAHISALRREYQNFLSNNMALKGDEIKEGKQIMDENSTPAQIESAAKAFMQTAIGRVSALNNRAQRFNVPVGEILTPQNMQTIRNMGLGDYANQMIAPAQRQQHMFNGGAGGGPQLDQSNPPPIDKVPPGQSTTFANGQVWRNDNGKLQRIK